MKMNKNIALYALLISVAASFGALKIVAAEKKVQYAEVAEGLSDQIEAFKNDIENLDNADLKTLGDDARVMMRAADMNALARSAVTIDPALQGKPLMLFRKLLEILHVVYQQSSENFIFVHKMLDSLLYQSIAEEEHQRHNPYAQYHPRQYCPKINDECAYRPFMRSFIKLYYADFVAAHNLGIAIYALDRSVKYLSVSGSESENLDSRLRRNAQAAIDKYRLRDEALVLFKQYEDILQTLYDNNTSETGLKAVKYIAGQVDGILDREFYGISITDYVRQGDFLP